jgi:uncharacterized membrane protein YGL010W
MAASSLFDRQMTIYAAYHRDRRNRVTHFVGIPAIVFALLVPLALVRFTVAGTDISLALVVAAAVLGLWLTLDVVIGAAMAVVLFALWLTAEWVAGLGAATAWIVFGVFFAGGWAFQLLGHAFEGRRPALVDNLFQALIGPMFLMAELFGWLGLPHGHHSGGGQRHNHTG